MNIYIVCPRPYRMANRNATSSRTRMRILEAARFLLADESQTDLSMDAIARRANVSRLTLYYQFRSRPGLLEALYDHLAKRGGMQRMAEIFHEPDSTHALEKLVKTFVSFWSSDQVVIRRLRGMAVLDAEIDRGIRARDARRRHAARNIMERISATSIKNGKLERPKRRQNAEIADVLTMLTSFESYDALARVGQSPKQIIANLIHLVHFAAGI